MKVALGLAFALTMAPLACNEDKPAGFAGKTRAHGGKSDNSDGDCGGCGDADSPDPDDTDKPRSKPTKKPGPVDTDTDTNTDSNGTDSDTDTDNEAEIAADIAKIPGVEIVRLGVNFEDLGFSNRPDNDYNDVVLCFQGNFKLDGTNVVSIKKQTVVGTTFSASACRHIVRVIVYKKDGSMGQTADFDSRANAPVAMTFDVGYKLEVFMTPTTGCDPGVLRNMHEPQHARVQANVCNNSGI